MSMNAWALRHGCRVFGAKSPECRRTQHGSPRAELQQIPMDAARPPPSASVAYTGIFICETLPGPSRGGGKLRLRLTGAVKLGNQFRPLIGSPTYWAASGSWKAIPSTMRRQMPTPCQVVRLRDDHNQLCDQHHQIVRNSERSRNPNN